MPKSMDPLALTLAVLALLGMVGGAAYSVHASLELARHNGTSAIATGPDRVALAAGDRLFLLDGQGRPLARATLAELGLGRLVSDVGLKGDRLLVADALRAAVLECELTARSCTPYLHKEGSPDDLAREVLKFAVREDGRVYLADGGRSVVERYSRDGEFETASDARLRRPLGVAFAQGGPVVADMRNRRLVALKESPDGTLSEDWSFRTETELAPANKQMPAFLAHGPDGRWWVGLANSAILHSRLVIFSAAGEALQAVELPPEADPIDLAPLGERMLVADFGRYVVHQVSRDGELLEPFGNAEFLAALAAMQAEKEALSWWREFAWGLLAGGILLGLGAGLLDLKARAGTATTARRVGEVRPLPTSTSALRPAPMAEGEVLWLSPNRTMSRLFAVASLGVATLPAVLFLGFEELPAGLLALPVGMLATVLLMGVGLWVALRRIRLGIAGERLIAIGPSGKRAEAPAAEVLHSDFALLIGTVTIALSNPLGAALFNREAIRTHVQPLLAPANHLTPGQLSWRWLRRQPWYLQFGMVLALLGPMVLMVGLRFGTG